LARVQTDADHAALADAARRAQLARLADMQATVQRLGAEPAGADPEIAAAAERVRRVAGALTWQLAQEFPDRLWQANKAMRTIDSELQMAQAREAALVQAQRDEPARHEAFALRIAEQGATIRALIPQVAALTQEQQAQLQNLAVAELERQQQRLTGYTTQARFAVAQLYDRAALARKPDEVPAK
jgi:hypothetical protein